MMTWMYDHATRDNAHDNVGLQYVTSHDDERQRMMTMMTTKCSRKSLL